MNAQSCGKFIAQLRISQNLTQKELADKLNVSDKAVSRWETGKGFPDIDSLQALSTFFDITINELLAGEKAETKTIQEIAESNIIFAIEYTEKNKKKNKTTAIASVMVAIIFLIPLLKDSIEGIIKLLTEYTLVEEPWIILFKLFISLCILLAGFSVYKGHYKILHKYHYRNVTDFNGFCREMGKELMLCSVPLLISTILELWISIEIIALLSRLVLAIGFSICFIFIFKTLLKYNKSIF